MKKSVLLFFLLAFAGLASAQTQNFWTKKNDFGGMKRERAVAVSINGKAYAGTGVDTNEVTKNDWWEYDPVTDTWMQKATLPGTGRRNAVAFVIGDKAYVGTGMDSTEAQNNGNTLKDIWRYDPVLNNWIPRADFPGAGGNGIYFATAFSLDNKGYIVCGKRGPALYSKEVWEYKPTQNTWLQLPDFPGGLRYQLLSFVIGQKAYVGLGTDQNIYRKDIWEFNPGNGSWTQKADFAGGERGSASSFVLGERGFICLGVDGGLKKDLWEYNPYLDTWTARANFDGSERKEAIAFALNGKGYAGTGDGYTGKKAGMFEYTPVLILGTGEQDMAAAYRVFPNPVIDHFTVDDPQQQAASYAVYALDGAIVQTVAANASGKTSISRNACAPGVYMLAAFNAHQQRIGTQRLIFIAQ